ncbi:DNA topoisomerase VI subunit B [Candidatus Woesearchaeota archaeon]|nr:DNA topoisomerase VI subunit B [Candidatus Woesearchaeota archaeon]
MATKPDIKKEIEEGQTILVTEEVHEQPKITDRYRIIIEDNGPGVVKKQIPNIFARLLYGSKFHTLKQSRGQQGIGISAAALYGQLTTGKPVKIISKISPKSPAHYYELKINTQNNEPQIITEKEVEWNKEHGTKVEIDLEGTYQSGGQSVDKYLKQTAIVNPHVTIIYASPLAKQVIFPRAVEEMPAEPKEIKPHPYGVELGRLIKMMQTTKARNISGFLQRDFSRVGSGTAKNICQAASILPDTKPKRMTREMAERLIGGIKKTKIMNPPTNCISPIGAEALEKGLRKEIKAEFYAAATRPPAVYRGNPFIVEAGIAYGGEQEEEGQIRLLRFANRVPLLYQPGACAINKSVIQTNWRNYGLSQSKGALPIGPCTIIVHIASVWVPFTSESKEAIAHYPEIIKEIKLAVQEAGRKLAMYVKKKRRIVAEGQKRDYIETYIPHVADALRELLKLKEKDEKKIEKMLKQLLEKQRGKLDEIKIDESEFDKDLALEEKSGD